jgi:hypothetical protein
MIARTTKTDKEQVGCRAFHGFIHPPEPRYCQQYHPVPREYLAITSICRKSSARCGASEHITICLDQLGRGENTPRHLPMDVLSPSSTAIIVSPSHT